MLVSQKIFVRNAKGNILALRRTKTDTNRPLTWDLPGGQLEEGENLEESARREIREETGLEVSNLKFVYADARNAANGEYWVVLLCTAETASESVTLSSEHDQYEWLTQEEFLKRRSSARIEDFLRNNKL